MSLYFNYLHLYRIVIKLCNKKEVNMKKTEFLRVFRTAIQEVIREEIRSVNTAQPTWMRSSQVREMLNISDSTLQTFRINGTIPGYKLDNMWLYKYDEIIAVLEANRIGRKELSHE